MTNDKVVSVKISGETLDKIDRTRYKINDETYESNSEFIRTAIQHELKSRGADIQ